MLKVKRKKKNDYTQYLGEKKKKYNLKNIIKFILICLMGFILTGFIIAFFVIHYHSERKIQSAIYDGNFNEAIDMSRKYLEKNKSSNIKRLLAEALFIKSLKKVDNENIDSTKTEIKKIFKELISNDIVTSNVLFMYGFLIIEESDRIDYGVDLLKESIEMNKKDGKLGAYINRRIITINNIPLGLVDIYERVAASLFELKRYKEAIDYYNFALKIKPKTIHYFFNALINKELGNFNEVRRLVDIVLKTEKNKKIQSGCYLLLAHIEFSQKNYEKAEDFFKKTLEIDLQSADSYYFLGRIYRIRKNLAMYNKYMKKAAEAGHEQAKRLFPSYGLKTKKDR